MNRDAIVAAVREMLSAHTSEHMRVRVSDRPLDGLEVILTTSDEQHGVIVVPDRVIAMGPRSIKATLDRDLAAVVHSLHLRREGVPEVGAYMRPKRRYRRAVKMVTSVNIPARRAKLAGVKRDYAWSELEYA